MEKRNWTG